MLKPSNDWTGYTLMDGIGKLTVMIRNGKLSTGYQRVNDLLPPFIRCMGEKERRWVFGMTGIPIPELDGMFPNQVVHHYHKKARETEETATEPASRIGMSAMAG